MKRAWIGAGAVGLALAVGLSAPAAAEGVEVGERIDYQFRRSLVNGRGAKSMEDFRGRPVLVEFWGTR